MQLLTGSLIALILALGTSLYLMLNLAIENDGLRQVVKGQRESLLVLLDYSTLATSCDLKIGEASTFLGSRHSGIELQPDSRSVAGFAFRLSFVDETPAEIEIVGVGKARLCERQQGQLGSHRRGQV